MYRNYINQYRPVAGMCYLIMGFQIMLWDFNLISMSRITMHDGASEQKVFGRSFRSSLLTTAFVFCTWNGNMVLEARAIVSRATPIVSSRGAR